VPELVPKEDYDFAVNVAAVVVATFVAVLLTILLFTSIAGFVFFVAVVTLFGRILLCHCCFWVCKVLKLPLSLLGLLFLFFL